MQPSHVCMLLYETARRLYVLQRLVDEMRYFYVSRANAAVFMRNLATNQSDANDYNLISFFSHKELDRALDFMEWEVEELKQQDPVQVLATWGSLAWRPLPSDGSMVNWQHRRAARELAATAALYHEDEDTAAAAMRRKKKKKTKGGLRPPWWRRPRPPTATTTTLRRAG
ncbi:hypothetical protein STCU_12301 [Strigomonas culicis]|uniref:Uncharacterized protein n=1 Tax=Strigomonas culicis TaxID=28005 RepID=S9TDZ3_9TRYP|nr:hypothetical protein STCU_12301 [Strigomonas culicis]|eukprot:EPY15159.1 hypothetical protein STCU_12301 [Strigomonas culicis]